MLLVGQTLVFMVKRELREDSGVFHGVQAPCPEPECRASLGERAVDVLFLPGRAGPQRRLIEPGNRSGGDQCTDQRHHVRRQIRGLGQAGMDEPVRDGSAGDELSAPLHRGMLEDDQVNASARSRGPMDNAASGTPAGRGAVCALPHAHRTVCGSCWTRSAAATGISSC
jgi:hypothetical protein